MVLSNGKMAGPLKDILDEAAAKLGYKVKWRPTLFNRSLKDLQTGLVDIVPKTFYRKKRSDYIHYLGPLFKRTQRTNFLVRPGMENKITCYEDLLKYKIGVKRSSFYFEKFNEDKRIQTIQSFDDFNMSDMFIKGRFDVMAIIDPIAIEEAFRKREYKEFSYAEYSHTREMGLYYAFSKKSKHVNIKDKLNKVLMEMSSSGRVNQIYAKYQLAPTVINNTLIADFRHRPPAMVLDGDKTSGPLKEVLERAASTIGFQIRWNITPFANSLTRIKEGFVDIVPRTIKTKERKKHMEFLGPIGQYSKNIYFLVHKGKEKAIQSYNDLRKFKVGIKRGTHYFFPFQDDGKITKIPSLDDKNMSHMFMKNRFEVMAVLDPEPIIEALHRRDYYDFSFANFFHKNAIQIFFAFSKKSQHIKNAGRLNAVLNKMMKSGEIAEIFAKYNVLPPSSN